VWGLQYAIETCGLTKKFYETRSLKEILAHPFQKREVPALEAVDLQIREGELFGVLGHNGAGKTTLIKILCTLVLPDGGEAYVNGYDVVKEEKQVRASLGLVNTEERSFYWRLTGRQNLEFFAAIQGLHGREAEERISGVLDIVELKGRADDRFDNYSTGMKHRLAIARGLLGDPEVLFMDEPARSLDPYAASRLRSFIREGLVGEQGKTVFLSTHQLDGIEQLCDRLAVLEKGRIKACGTAKELRKKAGGKERYLLEVESLPENVPAALGRLEGVLEISTLPLEDGDTCLDLILSNGRELLPPVLELLSKAGCRVLSCERRGEGFEAIFSQDRREEEEVGRK